MLFNSYIFVFAFMPICLIGFYLLERVFKAPKCAKVFLTLMSLWFYGYFNLNYLAIMLFSIAFNFVMYKLMMSKKSSDNVKIRRTVMIVGVLVNVGLLFYFKYFDFFISNCNAIFGTEIPLKNILLPLGISFFTFQQIGFLTDSYRGEIPECDIIDYSLFVSFFPQLIAGPIVNHDEMLPQFAAIGKREFNTEKFARGIYIFVLGMGKKVLLADTFGKAVDFAYMDVTGINATESLLTILFYTLQLYFDFSGYCDMAIGLGQLLGIDIPVNFNSPYKAVNIVDFWKRWHITLSRFFTKNIYIPLGGNRKGAVRMYVNLFLVFFISGVWHGAGWNFILWGCMHGVLYVITRAIERLLKKRRTGEPAKAADTAQGEKKVSSRILRVLGVIFTFIFVNIAWVYFRAPSVSVANSLISNLWNMQWAIPSEAFVDGFNLGEFWYVMKMLHLTDFAFSKYILAVAFTVFALVLTFFGKNVHELADGSKYKAITAIGLAIMFVWCVVSLAGVSTFLYFNF